MAVPRLTSTQWLICGIAAIGFAFDIYEILMLPLIVRPALMDLVSVKPGTPEFNEWVGLLLWIPALAGGVFGLLGGYLTDRLGPPDAYSRGASLYMPSPRSRPA